MAESKSVLLVDDNEDIIECMELELAPLGLTLTRALDGDIARQAVKAKSFDLVVSDITMPALNGLELLSFLKTEGLTMPVILVTGFGSMDYVLRAWKLGATDFIEKPFLDGALLESVRWALTTGTASLPKGHYQRQILPVEKTLFDAALRHCEANGVSFPLLVHQLLTKHLA